MTQLVKPSFNKPKERKFVPQAMTVSTGGKRKKSEWREYESPSPILCKLKELDVLLDKWIVDGVFKPNHVSREPNEE